MSELTQESPVSRGVGQQKQASQVIHFLQNVTLPEDYSRAKEPAAQESVFGLMDGILHYVDTRHGNPEKVAVPSHLPQQSLKESRRGVYSSHFSGNKLYNTLLRNWWWTWDVCSCYVYLVV